MGIKKKKKLISLPKLKKKTWKIFSEWVRSNEADFAGYVACCCCDKQYIWNSGDIHAGHWIHDKLDYEPMNVHPQCKNCNFKYNKNTNTLYAIYMARKYGVEEMENLRKLAYTFGNSYSREELEKLITKYGRKNTI